MRSAKPASGAVCGQAPDAGFAERIQAYALKDAREGKAETSWLNPHAAYESGVRSFIAAILDHTVSGEFQESLQPLARRLALLGALNSLSQLTLKATLPGVPDFYQGTEFWDLSLVDPDNRRPVDFAARHSALGSLEHPDWSGLVQDWSDGRIKLAWTRQLLKLRSELADVFSHGDYQPLDVSGPHAGHVTAFARRHGRSAVIVAVGRLFAPLTNGGREWPRAGALDAAIAIQDYSTEQQRGSELQLSQIFGELPVAVLTARSKSAAKPARRRERA